MPDIIVFLTDTSHPDPKVDCRCFKRGDVADIMPAGLNWQDYPGIVEQVKSGKWAVLSVPDMKDSEAESLLMPEPGDQKLNPLLQIRYTKINLDALSEAAKLADPAKVPVDPNAKVEAVTAVAAEVVDMVVIKPALAVADVIGPADANIIGPK